MAAKNTEERVRYNDLIFFVVLIPFVNALNYYLTYTNIALTVHTLVTFTIDTLQGYAAWLGLRSVVLYLDEKMRYEENPLKRILVQLLLSSAVGLLITILLTELLNTVAKPTPVPARFYLYDIFIFLIWFFVLNVIYIGLHYYHGMKNVERLRLENKKVRVEGFAVKDGRRNLVVAFDTTSGFFVDDDYTS